MKLIHNILLEMYRQQSNMNSVIQSIDRLIHTKGFNIDILKKYLPQYFDNICYGSSRVVCEFDDDLVIKIACGSKQSSANTLLIGSLQNKNEFGLYNKFSKNPILTKVYFHAEDFSWIVSENVIPAHADDFENILGIKFNDDSNGSYQPMNNDYSMYKQNTLYTKLNFKQIVHSMDSLKELQEMYGSTIPEEYKTVWNTIQNNNFLSNVWKLANNSDLFIQDMLSIENWGITKRDGNSALVLLDSGLTNNDFDRYY